MWSVGGRDDDQAVDAAREHGLDQLALALGVLVGAAGEGDHAARARATSSTPRWMAEKNGFETSSKIRPSEADSAVRAAQRAGGVVVAVAEHLDRALDLDGELRRDRRAAVDDARDRAEADARDRGDVLHRRPAAFAERSRARTVADARVRRTAVKRPGSRPTRARSGASARRRAAAAIGARQPGEQQLGGVAAERVRVLGDDGHARVDEVAEHDVVEADERDLALAGRARAARGSRRS